MDTSTESADADSGTDEPQVANDEEEEIPIQSGFAGMMHFNRRDEIEKRLTIDTDYAAEPRTAISALRKRADQLEEEHDDGIDTIPPEIENKIAEIHLMATKLEQASESASYPDEDEFRV